MRAEWKEIKYIRIYNRQALYTSSPKRECEGRQAGECIAKCPMWYGKRVEGTGRVTDMYYVVWEAEFTGGMSARSGMETRVPKFQQK